MPFPIRFVSNLLLLGLALASPAGAQDAVVQPLAALLAAEDARRYDEQTVVAATTHANALVRRYAARSLGRIGDPEATPHLLALLRDADQAVRAEAAFALGQLGDRTALAALTALVEDSSAPAVGSEAATAIAKIGGDEAARFVEELLVRWAHHADSAGLPPAVVRSLGELWRLRELAPVAAAVPFGGSGRPEVRLAAVYAAARLRAVEAASLLLAAADDDDALVRSLAARALTGSYADSAGLDRKAVAGRVRRLVEDPDRRVRVNALRTLATLGDSGDAPAVVAVLSDPDPNVRVQAVETLGALGGAAATEALQGQLDAERWAVRRQALLGLAAAAPRSAMAPLEAWARSEAWEARHAAASAAGAVGGGEGTALLATLVADADSRVAAEAYAALVRADTGLADARARTLLAHPDPAVRTLAADRVRASPRGDDVAPLVQAYETAQRDPFPDARIAAMAALGTVAELGFSERVAVEEAFLDRYPTCSDDLVRRAAGERFPAAAARWGPAAPVATGRTLDDYRRIVRAMVLPAAGGELPRVSVETERGTFTVELFAGEAPVTVSALLDLVGRGYFDEGRWHRVVPNFVIQGGDPRGDGWGGPGFALRDENSRRRYGTGTVGMALSGPDSGGSQFFVTHSPQPHLDGIYPVIGRVVDGMEVVQQVTQGDRIRAMRTH